MCTLRDRCCGFHKFSGIAHLTRGTDRPTAGCWIRSPEGLASCTRAVYRAWRTVPLRHADRDTSTPFQGQQGADSRGGCNTCYALSSSSSRCLGVSPFSVLRGQSLSWSAMASRSASVRSDRSVPLGMYWRNSPFVFSLVPRCQGECGSQKYTSRPSSEAILRC